jgi:hypothetical protein
MATSSNDPRSHNIPKHDHDMVRVNIAGRYRYINVRSDKKEPDLTQITEEIEQPLQTGPEIVADDISELKEPVVEIQECPKVIDQNQESVTECPKVIDPNQESVTEQIPENDCSKILNQEPSMECPKVTDRNQKKNIIKPEGIEKPEQNGIIKKKNPRAVNYQEYVERESINMIMKNAKNIKEMRNMKINSTRRKYATGQPCIVSNTEIQKILNNPNMSEINKHIAIHKLASQK